MASGLPPIRSEKPAGKVEPQPVGKLGRHKVKTVENPYPEIKMPPPSKSSASIKISKRAPIAGLRAIVLKIQSFFKSLFPQSKKTVEDVFVTEAGEVTIPSAESQASEAIKKASPNFPHNWESMISNDLKEATSEMGIRNPSLLLNLNQKISQREDDLSHVKMSGKVEAERKKEALEDAKKEITATLSSLKKTSRENIFSQTPLPPLLLIGEKHSIKNLNHFSKAIPQLRETISKKREPIEQLKLKKEKNLFEKENFLASLTVAHKVATEKKEQLKQKGTLLQAKRAEISVINEEFEKVSTAIKKAENSYNPIERYKLDSLKNHKEELRDQLIKLTEVEDQTAKIIIALNTDIEGLEKKFPQLKVDDYSAGLSEEIEVLIDEIANLGDQLGLLEGDLSTIEQYQAYFFSPSSKELQNKNRDLLKNHLHLFLLEKAIAAQATDWSEFIMKNSESLALLYKSELQSMHLIIPEDFDIKNLIINELVIFRTE